MALTQVTGPYPIFTDLDGTPLDDGYLYIGAINQDPEQNPIQVFWDANLTIPATQPIRTSNGYAYRNGTPALLYTAGEFSITIRNKREEFVLYSPVGYGFDPAAVSASVVKNDFIGDGVEVDFTLSSAPSTILATNVFINGVYQEKDSYGLSGNVITFSIAPPLSSSIEIMTNETGIINAGNATAISYTLTAPNAVQQTVQTKLEQYVSVKDFGAIGDGVTDDTAAIQDAIDYIGSDGTLEFPDGTYKVTATLTLSGNGVWLQGSLNSFIKRYGAFEILEVTGNYNKISDMQFSGNKASYPFPTYPRSAILMVSGDFNSITGCQIEDSNSHGILFRTGGAPQFNLVENNIVLNCEEIGIAHDGGTDNRILGNHVSGCGYEGITLDQSSYRCIVDSNRLNANCLNGGVGSIGVDWTDLCVISNNVITDSGAINAITFQNNLGPSNNNVISGNVFDGNPAYAIELKTNTGGSCAGNVISGNMFRTAGSIKIDAGCQDNVLSGNFYDVFPVIDPDSYNRIDNGLVSFLAQNTVARTNVTGNGTAYVVPFNNIAQERFTVSTGSFNTTTGVFTAPINALYSFSAAAEITSASTASSMLIEIITSGGTFSKVYQSNGSVTFGGAVSGSLILKEGQTAYVQVTVFGGTLSFSVTANVNANFFSAALVG